MNPYSTELCHHGILGQKWGVRRFQNKDGTLTAEGKKHYDTYKEQMSKGKKVMDETDRLIKSNKQLKWGFGKASNIDDMEFFEMEAYEAVGKKAMQNWEKLRQDSQKYYDDHKESIEIGRKIAKKLLKE